MSEDIMSKITFRIDHDTKAHLEAHCEKMDRTKSDLIRKIVRRYYRKHSIDGMQQYEEI
jgi:antitoxin component of RelBE/YafQ-DinJ toxin-antitoxin module